MRLIKNENLYIPVMAVLCCLTGLFYIINYPRRQLILVAGLIIISFIIALIYKKKTGKIKEAMILAILISSFLIKADYVVYTPVWVRQHDVIGFGAGFGQAAFIEYFYEKIRLIDFDPRQYWGFFQPPLHHMIAGIWLRIMNIICPNYDWACDNVQLLTLFYSVMVPFISLKLYKSLYDKKGTSDDKALIFAVCFVAFHPCFILLSGSINNDILCILLQILAMYFFLKDDAKIVNIILAAIFLGLSMMTKLSGILVAPAIGMVMLYRLFSLHKIDNKKDRMNSYVNHIKSYLIFAMISIPLGIWSPVRNLIKFDVPLNYTPEVGEPLTGTTLFMRLFDLKTPTAFTCMIGNGNEYDEYNIFLGMIKTSLVGEYDFSMIRGATTAAWILLISGVLLGIWLFIRFVGYIFDKSNELVLRLFFGTYVITTLLFYVNLCFSIPNFSSMDFRYIAHLIVLGGVFICFGRKRKTDIVLYSLITIFSISSVTLYLLVGSIPWR